MKAIRNLALVLTALLGSALLRWHAEAQIIRAREPALPARFVAEITRFVARARSLELRKRPSIAEALDWAAALAALHADRLEPDLVRDTIGALLKDPADIAAVLRGRLET